MAYTVTYYEIRESDAVKFWHETDEVLAWFPEFQKKLDNMGYPCEETISEDRLIHIKKASFKNREDCEWVASLVPVVGFAEQRSQYNIENNIHSFVSEDFD